MSGSWHEVETQAQLGGLMWGDGAKLERPIRAGSWRIPRKVWLVSSIEDLGPEYFPSNLLEEERVRRRAFDERPIFFPALRWEWRTDSGPEPQTRSDDSGMIEAFVRLADGSEKDILKFATRYGPLFLCLHDQPATHTGRWDSPSDSEIDADWSRLKELALAPRKGEPTGDKQRSEIHRTFARLQSQFYIGCHPTRLEPISVWRDYAFQIRVAIAIAAKIHLREPGNDRDWCDLFDYGFQQNPPSRTPSLKEARQLLATFVQRWLLAANTRLELVWDGDERGPEVRLSAAGVHGAIGRQLAFALGQVDGFQICAGCGRPFFPTRRPVAGRLSWCSICGKKEAQKAASRRYRERRRK